MIHNSNYATTSNKNAMGSTVSSLRDANKVWTAPLLPQARQCLPWGTSSRVVAEEKMLKLTHPNIEESLVLGSHQEQAYTWWEIV